MKNEMLATINDFVVKEGFDKLTMDKISTIMGVSRAKLYQYFPSKEDVIKGVTFRYIDFMQHQLPRYHQKNEATLLTFPDNFFNMILLIGASTDIFRTDLKKNYPELYRVMLENYSLWNNEILDYFNYGKKQGYFADHLNPQLFLFQLETILPKLMDSQLLMEFRLFPEDVLKDYYQMILPEVIHQDHLPQIREINVSATIHFILTKFQRAF